MKRFAIAALIALVATGAFAQGSVGSLNVGTTSNPSGFKLFVKQSRNTELGGISLQEFGGTDEFWLFHNGTAGVLKAPSITLDGNVTITGTCTGCGGAGSTLPTSDANSIVEGSADGTKEIRFEVDGLTTGTIRTLTPQDASYTLAGINLNQTFSGDQTFSGTVAVPTVTQGDNDTSAASTAFVNAEIAADAQAADSDLTAVAGLSTTGLIARTGAGTAATRTVTGTADQVNVSNGDGVAGNPTLSLPQSIATTSTPQFARLGLGGAADTTAAMKAVGQYYSSEHTVTSSATPTFDWDNGNVQYMQLTANVTSMTLSDPKPGGRYILIFKQDATGGRTVAFATTMEFTGDTAPTVTSTANKATVISCVYSGVLSKYLCGSTLDLSTT